MNTLMLTPESREKIDAAIQPFIDALVNEMADQVAIALRDQVARAVLGIGNGTVAKPKTSLKKARKPDNGNGKRTPRRTDLNDSDKKVLAALKKRKGEPVQTGELDKEIDISRSTISNSLSKLTRYKLAKKSGKGRNIAYAFSA